MTHLDGDAPLEQSETKDVVAMVWFQAGFDGDKRFENVENVNDRRTAGGNKRTFHFTFCSPLQPLPFRRLVLPLLLPYP